MKPVCLKIATNLIKVIPAEVGPYLHIIVVLLGVPLDLLTSTDAYYFAVLPIVEQTAGQFSCTVCINSLFNGHREYYRYICQPIFTSLMVGNGFKQRQTWARILSMHSFGFGIRHRYVSNCKC